MENPKIAKNMEMVIEEGSILGIRGFVFKCFYDGCKFPHVVSGVYKTIADATQAGLDFKYTGKLEFYGNAE